MPARSGEVTNYINPGQFAGRLGPAWEPLLVRGELDKPRQLSVPAFELPADMRPERLTGRQTLLRQLDAWQSQVERPGGPLETLQTHQRRALSLLTSAKSKEAFDISREPEATRARYGEDINGQSLLMSRRLVEAGVPFVCVHWIGRKVGAGLHAGGYQGPAGLDAMIHRLSTGELRLRPIVEVNLRGTMGRVALAFQRRLRGGRVAVWRQIEPDTTEAARQGLAFLRSRTS